MPNAFLDSNILIYAAIDPEEREKHRIALDLLRTTDFGVSGQVLAEAYCVIARKAKPSWSEAQIELWLASLAEWPCVSVDAVLVRRGIAISRRCQIAYYDAAIIAAAERLEVETLYTEDLNDGQKYGSVTVRNPFN